MSCKIIIPDSCEPLGPGEDSPPLVLLIFGMFRDISETDGGPLGNRGEWQIVDDALSHGDYVMAAQIARRTNLRMGEQKENLVNEKESSLSSKNLPSVFLPNQPSDHRDLSFPSKWCKVQCTLESTESVSEVVEQCISKYGHIDIVINWIDVGFDSDVFAQQILAGIATSPPSQLEQQEEEVELRKLMDQNVFSLFNIIKGTLPALRRNIPNSPITPKIITISSSLGFVGGPGYGAYTASRWACEGMMECLSYEVQDQGIRTSIIDLGFRSQYNAKINSLGELIWELAHCKNPPIRIALGRQATKTVKDKLRVIVEEIEDWKYLFE